VRQWGGEMAQVLRIEVYRSPWWLFFLLVGGLVGAIITHVILQGRLELSRFLSFYISWMLGVIIAWSVIRKISAISK